MTLSVNTSTNDIYFTPGVMKPFGKKYKKKILNSRKDLARIFTRLPPPQD